MYAIRSYYDEAITTLEADTDCPVKGYNSHYNPQKIHFVFNFVFVFYLIEVSECQVFFTLPLFMEAARLERS